VLSVTNLHHQKQVYKKLIELQQGPSAGEREVQHMAVVAFLRTGEALGSVLTPFSHIRLLQVSPFHSFALPRIRF